MAEETIAGRYRLRRLLGKGAMSEVWAADDLELERPVALKLLAPDADRARFEREARAAAALAHPNITQLYDYGEAEGRPYMVLEYLPGGTLEDRLTSGKPLPDGDAMRISAELAAGLAHAHDRGLVHRDLKPANVLFDSEGRAKIADFGIARLGQGGTLTEAGTVLGTAAYISPEQAAGEPAGPASDVYSFGVMLFRMLTGRLPFEAEQPMDLVALHRDAEPPPLERFRSNPPPALAAIAAASLAKDPAARPADGRTLAAELGTAVPTATAAPASAVVDPGASEATRVLRPQRPPRRGSRRTLPAAIGVLALLAAGAAAAFALTRGGGDTGAAGPSTALPTIATRSLPTLSTRALSTPAPPATTASTSTASTTTRASTTPKPPPATTAPPATTVTPPPATTAPPPATTAPPPATTAPPPTDTTVTTVP